MYLDGKYYKDHDTFLRDKRKAERKAPLELHLTLNSPWEYDPSTPIDDFADVEFSSQGSEMSAKMQRCSEWDPKFPFETQSCECTSGSSSSSTCYCHSAFTACSSRCGCCEPKAVPSTEPMDCNNIYNGLTGFLASRRRRYTSGDMDGIFRPSPCFATVIEQKFANIPNWADGCMTEFLTNHIMSAAGKDTPVFGGGYPEQHLVTKRHRQDLYWLGKEDRVPYFLQEGLEYPGFGSIWYSFCKKKWVNESSITHCWACKKCRTQYDWHCAVCRKCRRDIRKPCVGRGGLSDRFWDMPSPKTIKRAEKRKRDAEKRQREEEEEARKLQEEYNFWLKEENGGEIDCAGHVALKLQAWNI